MLENPTCAQLIFQLEMLSAWLPVLVRREQGFAINLGLAEEDPEAPCSSVGEQLKSSSAHVEGPGSALHRGYLWMLTSDGNPLREGDWVPRRLWLSPSGRLWHDCLEKGRASQCFRNTPASALQVTRLTSGAEVADALGGETVYAFRVERSASIEQAGVVMFFAAASKPLQEAWIQCMENFKFKESNEEDNEEENVAVGGG